MQMGETNKNNYTKFLYEALYCPACCDQAACIFDALAWSLTQCRVFDPPDLSRGRLGNIASTCHGETQHRVLQVTSFFWGGNLFIQVSKVDKMWKIASKSVEDAGGSKTRLRVKDIMFAI